jgi:Bacterial dipeptidyl-peptidase Sh3 domain
LTAPTLDPRRNAYRPDLAAEVLRGKVDAPRYAAGELRQVVHSATPLRGAPDARRSWTTEALYGELVTVLEERDGWAWVQLERDG